MRKYLLFTLLWGRNITMAYPCPEQPDHLRCFDDYVAQIYQRQNYDEEQDFESVKDALYEAYASPLNLNKTTKSALSILGILSKNQIENYFNHLAATGPLDTKYELQTIPDFDLETIALLLPFVYIPAPHRTDTALRNLAIDKSRGNYFLLRYEPSLHTAIPPHPVKPKQLDLDSLDQYTIQLTLKHLPSLTLEAIARKQAREAFCLHLPTHRYGFTLWSIYMVVTPKQYIQKIIIGDYQIDYGQGLLLDAGYNLPKGANIISIMHAHNIGIRPCKGIRRIGLQGIALSSSALKPITLTGFYSDHKLDATIALDQKQRPYVNYINPAGKYPTLHALNNKGNLREQLVGCALLAQLHNKQTEIGGLLIYQHYDRSLIFKKRSKYGFQGEDAIATSLFYRFLWKNILCFGEGSMLFPDHTILSQNCEKALITGMIINLSRYIDLSTALYHYGKAFFSPYGHAFKYYTTDNSNEKGFYGNLILNPINPLAICPKWPLFFHLTA